MNEGALRWKGRIGSMKGGCGLLLILAIILICFSVSQINTAMKNPDEPRVTTLTELVNGDLGTGMYVEVSGIAIYDAGYSKTEDNTTTETYYFLIDPDTGDMILIKHHSALIIGKEDGYATVSGMTRSSASDLKSAIKEDEATFTTDGLRTTSKLYIADGQEPPDMSTNVVMLVIMIIITVLCSIPFFFPSIVFAPYPLDTTIPVSTARAKIKATGKFQKLKSREPLEIGKGMQKFNNGVANLILRAELDLMIYIHHIVKTKRYGVTLNTTESDWAIFLNGENVQSVESGKILGWKDKLAIRFTYMGPKDKEQALFILLENAGDQAQVVELLRKMRFQVYTADMV
jgi:hypothetical protein